MVLRSVVDGQGNKVAKINQRALVELFRAGVSSCLENPEILLESAV